MKKVFSIIAVAFIAASFAACGQSTEDKDKMDAREKEMKDSMARAINNDIDNAGDSTAAPAATPDASTTAPATEEHH